MMKPKVYITAMAAMALLSLQSCHRHDVTYTDDCLLPGYSSELTVQLNVEESLFDYKTVASRAGGDMQLRYVVWALTPGEGAPVAVASSSDRQVKINLPLGKFDIVAFADYVPAGSVADHYFLTDQIHELIVKDKYNYVGAEESKLAFYGRRSEVTVAYKNKPVQLMLTPAMAQYRIIPADTPDFTVGKVAVNYPEGLPCAISGIDGSLCYTWADVMYAKDARPDILIFDNVFCDYKEQVLPVNVEIYDTEGNLRARKLNLEVPLRRGGITTVQGDFYSVLDREAPNGSGIQSEFNSTVFIEI